MFTKHIAAVILIASLVFPQKASLTKYGQAVYPTSPARLLSASDSELIIEFSTPDYQLRPEIIHGQTFFTPVITGANYTDEVNYPRLPVIGTLLGVPANASFELVILKEQVETIEKDFKLRLVNSSDQYPVDGLADETAYVIPQGNPGNPNLDEVFPEKPVQIGQVGWFRDQRVVPVRFYPFQYDHRKGDLILRRYLQVKIKFLGDNLAQSVMNGLAESQPIEQILETQLLNYEQARSWRNDQAIVSQQIFIDNARPMASSQKKYRIPINKNGLYRLTYQNLIQAGIPAGDLEISKLLLSNQGRDVAFHFEDKNSNLIFDTGDSILFYGEKFNGAWMATRYASENINWHSFNTQLPDGSTTIWKPEMNAMMIEKYTDDNVYWLIPNSAYSAQMHVIPNQVDNSPFPINQGSTGGDLIFFPLVTKGLLVPSFLETIRAEQSNLWKTTLFTSEDTWFWDEIKTSSQVTRSYSINLVDPVPVTIKAQLGGELVAATYNDSTGPDHHIQVFLNDSNHTSPVYDGFWDGKSRFHFDAEVDAAKLMNGANQIDLVVYKTPALALEDIYVDWFEITYNRRYTALDNQLTFSTQKTGLQNYRIDGYTASEIGVYDITNPVQPVRISNFFYSNGSVWFKTNQNPGARNLVASAITIPANQIAAYTPKDFSASADYIVITHKDFISGVQPLADYRAAQGLSTLVVDVNDLYNEFNDGIYNPIAIKNFIRYTFQNWSKPPTFVLLVGDGHWNFKGYSTYASPPNYLPPFLSWVDPWQGEVDSANLLATVVGDDPLPDVMISRIPVNNPQELANVIAKITSYEQYPVANWQKQLLFVADNADAAGDFIASSEAMINNHTPVDYLPSRVYINNTISCPSPAGSPCPAANQAILTKLNQDGAFLLNYFGHGTVGSWSAERIFTVQDISNLNNGSMLPIMLSMTCLDGYWSHPNGSQNSSPGPSLAEEIIRASDRGAIAAFSPTGLGLGTGHDTLGAGFFDAIFTDQVPVLGDAALSAKLSLFATGYNLDLLHTFTIFGDPALKLP